MEEAVILGAMAETEYFNSKTFCSITKTVIILLIRSAKCRFFYSILDSSLS